MSDTVTTSPVVLRTVLQNCRGVPFKGPGSLGGSRLKGPSNNRGVQGGRGEGGKVNLPPYKWLIHADGSANILPKRPLRDDFLAQNTTLDCARQSCAPGQRTPYDVQIALDAQETRLVLSNTLRMEIRPAGGDTRTHRGGGSAHGPSKLPWGPV